MRLLIIDSRQAVGLDFAYRAKMKGHDVKWAVPPSERNQSIGKGLVDRVDDWRDYARWCDIAFLTDNTMHLRELDVWRRDRGMKVIGATSEAAQWELDRTCGQMILEKHGVGTIQHNEFTDYDKAIEFVKKEKRRFVSKPCGDEPDKSLSYCSKSPEDMVYMLQRWKKSQRHKGKFILQEFVPGIEMAVGGWFGPGGFNAGWHENFEFKKMMAGDQGPNTGEMGTVLQVVRKSKLAQKVLAPLEDELDRMGYVGYVDVNCIIDEDGEPWPLEFTMRPGWPTFNIQMALHHGDCVTWLECLADGQDAKPFDVNKTAIGVVMAIPDFPYSHATRKEVTGIPIYGLTPATLSEVHLCEAMMGEAPQEMGGKIVEAPCIVTAGDYVLVATGVSETVRGARYQSSRILDRVKIPNSPFWRPDIGMRLKKHLPQLQKHGYATQFLF
jgi:phosphoribosylamine--glycine ligase